MKWIVFRRKDNEQELARLSVEGTHLGEIPACIGLLASEHGTTKANIRVEFAGRDAT